MHQIWSKIYGMIQEIVLAKCEVSIPSEPGEVGTMQGLCLWGCGSGPSWTQRGNLIKKTQRDGKWSSPPKGVFKINTNGSSRGNPGHVGIGEVGRDSFGAMLFFFSIYKGIQTNNHMEALALL